MLGQELDRLGRRLGGQETASCAGEALELLQVRQSECDAQERRDSAAQGPYHLGSLGSE